MDIVFNEISKFPLCASEYDANGRMEDLIGTIKKAKGYGFKSLRVDEDFFNSELMHNYTVYNWLSNTGIDRTSKDFLLSVYRTPFIKEDDSDLEEGFIDNDYFYSNDHYGTVTVEGLAVAHLSQSMAVSYRSLPVWEMLQVNIEDHNQVSYEVLNSSSADMVKAHEGWILQNLERELPVSALPPNEKPISLRDDHGKDKLEALAKRMVRSIYVIGIVNSMPFNPQVNNFIKSYKANGLIEVVMANTDEGFGMVVKTTATNEQEARRIADILLAEFG